MLYPLLHWFANNHCCTTFTYSTFERFKIEQLFTVSETDGDFQAFVKEFENIPALWNVIDYKDTPVGNYQSYQKDLMGISDYLNRLYHRGDFTFSSIVFPENDKLLQKIQEHFKRDNTYELSIMFNNNRMDYQGVLEYLNSTVSDYGKDVLINDYSEILPHHPIVEMSLYKILCLEDGKDEELYYRIGLFKPSTLTTMLTEVLEKLTAIDSHIDKPEDTNIDVTIESFSCTVVGRGDYKACQSIDQELDVDVFSKIVDDAVSNLTYEQAVLEVKELFNIYATMDQALFNEETFQKHKETIVKVLALADQMLEVIDKNPI